MDIKQKFGEAKNSIGELGNKAGKTVKKVKDEATPHVEKLAADAKRQSKNVADNIGNVGKAGIEKVQDKIAKKKLDKISKAEESDKEENNDKTKREKLDDILHQSVDQYNNAYAIMNDRGNSLYTLRERAIDTIQNVENLINSIANHPKEFDKEISEIIVKREEFKCVCDYTKEELEAAQKSALNAGIGASAGTAIVSVAPGAAMWIATTFGTASTGTAISALSGAAQVNAALAWLGGGTVAMSGGGMAGGSAFLALAGPVGWGIAGASLLTSIALFTTKKIKLDKQKKEEIDAVLKNTEHVKEVDIKIKDIYDKTEAIRAAVNTQYGKSLICFGKDYLSIPEDEQYQLGSLVNETKSLAFMLGKEVELNEQ